jgi:hypothetical protein
MYGVEQHPAMMGPRHACFGEVKYERFTPRDSGKFTKLRAAIGRSVGYELAASEPRGVAFPHRTGSPFRASAR